MEPGEVLEGAIAWMICNAELLFANLSGGMFVEVWLRSSKVEVWGSPTRAISIKV